MEKYDATLLSQIWDSIQMLDTKASIEETCITPELESLDQALADSLNEEQKDLFHRYSDLLSELNRVCEREAFIKGVKFATAYLAEAADK